MKTRTRPTIKTPRAGLTLTADEVIRDYRIAVRSRAASVIGRREVLTGKAPFGIFGDGKEIANLAMARSFREGDWRSGYYRDQTFTFAAGIGTLEQYFAQLYTDTDVERDPFSAGRLDGGMDQTSHSLDLAAHVGDGERHACHAVTLFERL